MSTTVLLTMPKPSRSIVFSFKATPELRQEIKSVAQSEGESASAFVKRAIAAQLLQVQKK